MAQPQRSDSERAVQAAVGKSRKLAARVPRLILEARRVASTVIHGLHGRRRAGPGENFWQYRHFVSGEAAQSIDWRRSARDDRLYVREREWEASHTIWLWADRSPSMDFSSNLTEWSKLDRALVVSFALAEVLVQGGERIGIPELLRPTANRNVIEKMAEAIVHDTGERPSLPPDFAPAAFSEILLLSDFWSPLAEFRQTIGLLAANGARGHVVQVVDPAEEAFPYGAGSSSSSRRAWALSPPAAPNPGVPITSGCSPSIARACATSASSSAGVSPSIAPIAARPNCCSRSMAAWAPVHAT